MKKVRYNKIFIGIIIATIVFSATGVLAASLLPANNVTYTNSATSQTTVKGALDELFNKVDINEKVGSTSLSGIGDATITGAISATNTKMNSTTANLDWQEITRTSGGNTTNGWEHWMYRPVGYGLVEVYGQINYGSFAMTTSYGTMYFGQIVVLLPFTFAAIHDYKATVFSTTGLINATMYDTNFTTYASYYIWNSKSETKDITLQLYFLAGIEI